MIYKLRVILDAEEDVFRDIEIDSTAILLDLCDAIKNSFLIEGQEMSSFYISDDDWNQGEEILLDESLGESAEAKNMLNTTIEEVLNDKSKRLLFVYDFLFMSTFFIEYMEEREGALDFPQTIYEFGVKPAEKEPKEQNFSSLEDFDDEEDESEDVMDMFGDLDDNYDPDDFPDY